MPSGLFSYNFNFLTGEETDPENRTSPNLVRQAATTYILAEYNLRTPDKRLRRAVEIALDAFRRNSLPITRTPLQHAIQKTQVLSLRLGRRTIQRMLNGLGLLYSRESGGSVISPDGKYETAWLGATALALAAELRYHRATGAIRFADLREQWLRGLLSLRLPGGGFRAAPHYTREEHYFNGEGWLALATYNDTFPMDQATGEVLQQLDEYLMERYSAQWNKMFYSWGTMAAEIRYRTTRDRKFVEFVVAQSRRYLVDLKHKTKRDGGINCAQLEGLGSALRVLDADTEPLDKGLTSELRQITNQAIVENRKLQIQPGQDRIALSGDAYLLAPQLENYTGAYLSGPTDPMTQIDITAHCLSAMMILEESAEP